MRPPYADEWAKKESPLGEASLAPGERRKPNITEYDLLGCAGETVTHDDVTQDELLEALAAMSQLDALIDEMLPAEGLTLEGEAEVLSTEYLVIAHGTFQTIHHLMGLGVTPDETDRTEDAAILMRRVYELYSRVAFIRADSDDWDGNALRIELRTERESTKAMRDVLEHGSNPAYELRYREHMDKITDIESELKSRFGEAKAVPSTTDIFKKLGRAYVLLWRHSSDVVHTNAVGRSLHRDGNILGTPSTPARQLQVIDWSIAAMADLTRTWAKILGKDVSRLEAFGDAHNARRCLLGSDPRR